MGETANTRSVRGRMAAAFTALLLVLGLVALDAPAASAAPPTPLEVAAEAESSSSITVTWDPGGVSASYRIYRSTSAGGPFDEIGDASAPPFTDSGLAPNTTYWYAVAAFDGTGESPMSDPAAATTFPAAPVLTAAAAGPSSINLSWTDVGADDYAVYRSLSENGSYTLVDVTLTPGYQDTGLDASTAYWYQVVARGTGGGTPSNRASATTLPPPPPEPPVISAAAQSTTEIEVSWEAVPGATSYEVWRFNPASGIWALIGEPTDHAHLDPGRIPGTMYTYTVDAIGPGGTSESSNEATATTPIDAPVLTGLVDGIGAVALQWTAVDGAVTYTLQRAPAGTEDWGDLVPGLTVENYRDDDVVPGDGYRYRVIAVGADASSDPSNVVDVTLVPFGPPIASVQGDGTTAIDVSWEPVEGAESYSVERFDPETGDWVEIAAGLTGTDHRDEGLRPGTVYEYRVIAHAGTVTSASHPVLGHTALDAPVLSVEPAGSDAARLTWTAVDGAVDYILLRAGPDGEWEFVAGRLTGLEYLDKGLATGVTYRYVVIAVSESWVGQPSNFVEVTLEPAPVPPTPAPAPAGPTQPGLPSTGTDPLPPFGLALLAFAAAAGIGLFRRRAARG